MTPEGKLHQVKTAVQSWLQGQQGSALVPGGPTPYLIRISPYASNAQDIDLLASPGTLSFSMFMGETLRQPT